MQKQLIHTPPHYLTLSFSPYLFAPKSMQVCFAFIGWANPKCTHTSPSIIEKMHHFTHFCSKSTNISPSIILCISKIAIVAVYIYTIIVAFYMNFLFFFSLFSHPILSLPLPSFFFYPLLNPTTNLYKSSNFSNLF